MFFESATFHQYACLGFTDGRFIVVVRGRLGVFSGAYEHDGSAAPPSSFPLPRAPPTYVTSRTGRHALVFCGTLFPSLIFRVSSRSSEGAMHLTIEGTGGGH